MLESVCVILIRLIERSRDHIFCRKLYVINKFLSADLNDSKCTNCVVFFFLSTLIEFCYENNFLFLVVMAKFIAIYLICLQLTTTPLEVIFYKF